jgi:GDPmannose 4,6-dehydratase
MWQILQLPQAFDFVIGTGILHSVRDFAEAAFGELGLDWKDHVQENTNFLLRKSLQCVLVADSSKLRSSTNWKPEVDFRQMVSLMVKAEKDSRL